MYNAAEVETSDPDLFWDPDFMAQDMLPATLFDTDFPFFDPSPRIQPPRPNSFSRFTSRLPPVDAIDDEAEVDDGDEDIPGDEAMPWSITGPVYDKYCRSVLDYAKVLPAKCSLPSRNNMALYVETYLACVEKFLPFIHPATFSVEGRHVELVLATAALGSLYRFEYPKSYELYFMAKTIMQEKLRREDLELASSLLSGEHHSPQGGGLQRMQTFILLISFASWADKKIVPDALSMSSQLATLVRENGISESDEMPHNIDWLPWVAAEERRRTLLSAYVLFNLHSIAFDTPPLILNHEVGVCLPGYAEQWRSKNAAEWHEATRQVERHFKEGLRCLFDGKGFTQDASVSSFSNYLLIHGLLQNIYIGRHEHTESLAPDAVRSFETALRTWQASWEITSESSLDPMSPKGPFGLTATALLRLAYIRLHCDLGPCRALLSRDVQRIADKRTNLDRSSHIERAVLHAAHALSLPVRLGIGLMSCSKSPIWTIEHSLCSLECALLLKDWLEMISMTTKAYGTEGLSKVETRLLGIITGIIKETSFAETLDILEDDAARFRRMAATVVKLWAHIFRGIHLLEIDNVIAAGLQLLADSSPE